MTNVLKLCGEALASLLIGFLLGSINPAWFISRRMGFDVREKGSGNAGATNVFFVVGKAVGLGVAAFDVGKGWLSCQIARFLFPGLRVALLLGGVGAVLGHIFPFYMQFRGGKGTACLAGLVLAYNPKIFLAFVGLAILIMAVTRYGCIAPSAISLIFPFYYAFDAGDLLGMCILFGATIPIVWRHMENFRNIRDGVEPRFSSLWNQEKDQQRIQAAKEKKSSK